MTQREQAERDVAAIQPSEALVEEAIENLTDGIRATELAEFYAKEEYAIAQRTLVLEQAERIKELEKAMRLAQDALLSSGSVNAMPVRRILRDALKPKKESK
jgi:hypothetical protein